MLLPKFEDFAYPACITDQTINFVLQSGDIFPKMYNIHDLYVNVN